MDDIYRMSNRYTSQDLNALFSEQGLGLGAPFAAPHAAFSSAQRSFGQIAGYSPHISAIPETHLHTIAAQGAAYKNLQASQQMLADPYAGLRISSQSNSVPSSKPLFSQDVVSQGSTIDTNKWGLSNFVSQTPGALGVNPAEVADFQSVLAGAPMLNPPPAHTSKASAPLGQRLGFGGADMFPQRTTKSPASQQFDHRSQSSTPVTSQSAMFHYGQPPGFQHKPDMLDNSMSYEAVSPATTPDLSSHNPQHGQQHGNSNYLSLQDLASISSTQQKLEVASPQQLVQKRLTPMVPDRHNKMQHKVKQQQQQQQQHMSQHSQDLYNGSSQVRQSPHNPSPIGSPPLHMSNPQTTMSSSSMGQAPPTVQAPADSTTKPKKSRSKKRKDVPMNDMKQDDMGQNYSGQTVLNAPDISQRGNNAFGSNQIQQQQQGYMQGNRNQSQQPTFSSGSLTNSAQNSPLMTPTYKATPPPPQPPQQQSSYAKNVPSPNIPPPPSSIQARSTPQQESPMLSGYQQPSPTNSVSAITYTVSDALEMSRQAVFAGHGLMEPFGVADINSFGMQESFSHQLGIDGMRRPDIYNGGDDSPYMNNIYGGQFVSPNNVLNMDIGGPSTIDQDAFSNLMVDGYDRDMSPEKRHQSSNSQYSLTVNVEASQDDDLSHLAQPVSDRRGSSRPYDMASNMGPAGDNRSMPQAPPPAAAPKQQVKNASGGTSFMDSFLSFIQGKKPETLSSMSSAIIQNKPQLPKYVPEPPRPRRPETSDRNRTSLVTFSDSDDDTDDNSSAVQKAISSLGHENDNVKISGLTMKINLSNVKRAEENAKRARQRKPAQPRKKKPIKEKKFGLKEEYRIAGESSGDESLPARQMSARKAKENKGKYNLDGDSDSDTLKPIRKPGEDSDSERYDSDVDPAWTPFALEVKKPPMETVLEPKRKRQRVRKPSKPMGMPVAGGVGIGQQPHVVELDSDSDTEQLPDLQVGEFVMKKTDLKNMESYPIWKIESGRMLHKFELFTENSRILHRSIRSFSSWLPNSRNEFKHIRVRLIQKLADLEYVEVLDEYKPKPQIDSKLEEQYEEHPLVNSFNVYLQIFLSQALEPGFLSAITATNERFYLDSLDRIDSACSSRLTEIDTQVHWRDKFKESMKSRPHIRELDRPNLKQSCQACESASQPAIKSVHLYGNPYDRLTLQEIPPNGPHAPMEFMIGKTASRYVKTYHNLYHFKYNLYKRCHAKITILQDGRAGDNAAILDQCLHNRSWVLQLFEDLKQMLEKG